MRVRISSDAVAVRSVARQESSLSRAEYKSRSVSTPENDDQQGDPSKEISGLMPVSSSEVRAK